MSKITSPILLDSTGQDINNTLKGIHDAIKAANTLIDDSVTSDKTVWSSQKIIDALAVEETASGTNSVMFNSIGSTRLAIKTVISNAPIQILATLNGEEVVDYLAPLNGTYYLDTGLFIAEDGTETELADHYIIAAQGVNVFDITGVDSVEVTYKTISKQGGGAVDFEIIHGGSAKEEA